MIFLGIENGFTFKFFAIYCIAPFVVKGQGSFGFKNGAEILTADGIALKR